MAFSEIFVLKVEINAQEKNLNNRQSNEIPKIKLFKLVKFKLSCYVDTFAMMFANTYDIHNFLILLF